ncbi:hypothetical protein BYI23_E002990 (plasmid) [Burkholderia sp. YI23]|nr:hypothetical protein BYI23_E002990 [Burkholderia sp. YI23]
MLRPADASRFSDDSRVHAGSSTDLIAQELAAHRMRGFTIESDAALEDGELVKLAACFLFGDTKWVVGAWPHEWSESLLSDKSRIKQLVAAGALIAAEIEHLKAAAMDSMGKGAQMPSSIDI